MEVNPEKKRYNESGTNFLVQLFEIISDVSNQDAITWMPNGKCFRIICDQKMADEILPKYYPNIKYKRFIRKLNKWNFKRILCGPQKGCFYNEYFQREKKYLCTQIHWKRRNGTYFPTPNKYGKEIWEEHYNSNNQAQKTTGSLLEVKKLEHLKARQVPRIAEVTALAPEQVISVSFPPSSPRKISQPTPHHLQTASPEEAIDHYLEIEASTEISPAKPNHIIIPVSHPPPAPPIMIDKALEKEHLNDQCARPFEISNDTRIAFTREQLSEEASILRMEIARIEIAEMEIIEEQLRERETVDRSLIETIGVFGKASSAALLEMEIADLDTKQEQLRYEIRNAAVNRTRNLLPQEEALLETEIAYLDMKAEKLRSEIIDASDKKKRNLLPHRKALLEMEIADLDKKQEQLRSEVTDASVNNKRNLLPQGENS